MPSDEVNSWYDVVLDSVKWIFDSNLRKNIITIGLVIIVGLWVWGRINHNNQVNYGITQLTQQYK